MKGLIITLGQVEYGARGPGVGQLAHRHRDQSFPYHLQ
jgi:hypothetical protein